MRGNRSLLFLAIALIIGGLLVFYFSFYHGKKSEQEPTIQDTAKEGAEDLKGRAEELEGEVAGLKEAEERAREEGIKGQAADVADECEKMERDLVEFFAYLDNKGYVRELQSEGDMLGHFKKVVHVLTKNPPTPAGEGLKQDIMIRNIYHFYRVLALRDLRLVRLILKHEADTLEINLALLYRWLMSAEQCNQKDGLPPSLDSIYRYAGFLVNSIGGRAYLFRRQTRLRLLVNYYCLLIIHEADKKKMNTFGIDITPFLEPLAEEIENYQFLYYRKEYAGKLVDLKNYYLKKRKAS